MIKYILIIALIVRLILINQSFWLDEAISAITADKPFPTQWTGIEGDFQPPLYYLLLHFYMKIPIHSEWFLRLPSIIFGLITVYLLYRFTKSIFDEKTALLSSLFLSVSQFHVFYSQELRMYSLLCLMSLLSMWLFYKQKWILFTIVSIFGLYTNYMFFFIFVAQLIWMIYKYWGQKNIWLKWLSTLIISLIVFIPWLPILFKQYLYSRNLVIELPAWKNVSSPPIWKIAPQAFIKFSLGRINFDNKTFYQGVFALLFLLYGYILLTIKKYISDKILYLMNWLVSPLIASILLSFFIPVAGVWRLIFLLPPFYMLVSFGVTKLNRAKIVSIILIFVSVISLLLYWFIPKYQREPWREAVNLIEEKDYPVVFTVSNGFAPYNWYKKKEKIICGLMDLDKCLKDEGLYYVSYLQDLFDINKSTQDKINLAGYHVSKVKDYPGIGFVYFYENSN